MRRFTNQIHRVISATLTFLQRLIEKILPASPQPTVATASAGNASRRSRLRGVHAVPLVAVLALGATAFAFNTDTTPTQAPIAVGQQIPHSTPTTTAPGESDAEQLAQVEKLAEAQERAAVAKKLSEKKAQNEKAAAEKAAAKKAESEKAESEKAAAEKAEAARNAAPPEPTTQPAPEPQPVSANGACGGNLPPCCVMMRESGGSPTVVNSSSGAAGKWQFMTSTWSNYGGYATASQAPEHVQDERAAQLWAGGSGAGHWGGGC